jgi:hypothetical protein
MPTKSRQQQKLMFAAARDPGVAKKTGVPQKVAREFTKADLKRGPASLPWKVKAPKKPGR